jgi:hypothetical protein
MKQSSLECCTIESFVRLYCTPSVGILDVSETGPRRRLMDLVKKVREKK